MKHSDIVNPPCGCCLYNISFVEDIGKYIIICPHLPPHESKDLKNWEPLNTDKKKRDGAAIKQPTPEQIEAAIVDRQALHEGTMSQGLYDALHDGTVEVALRFLQKAMGEPPIKAMDDAWKIDEPVSDYTVECIWEALRDHILREVENDA